MKQIAQYQDGRLELQTVEAPQVFPGGILVEITHSVISPGTEKMKVEQAKMNLIQKAKARPDQVKKVLDSAKTLGWQSAMIKVKNRLESPTPLGYSAAGRVIAVSEEVTNFAIGDLVAVGGAECAYHAETVAVPKHLAAKIPEGVEAWQAAYTTLCSIAMHGVRQSQVTLGERVMVIGQGLVGLLTTAILKAAGARVLAIDIDPAKLSAAKRSGAEITVNPRTTNLAETIREWTNGYGVDAALLCVGGGAAKVAVDQAVDSMRDRGKLVIVGILDVELKWKELYHKEIEVKYSRSYGPGRYDPPYEWGGNDYPIGYVRWTEERNFESCLELIRNGQIDLSVVTTRKAKFEDSIAVYDALMEEGNADIGVVLEYAPSAKMPRPLVEKQASTHKVANIAPLLETPVKAVDVAGAGNFVKTMLLPYLQNNLKFGTIINQSGLSSKHVQNKFNFAESSTNFDEIMSEPANNGLLIGTRHHLHAPMVLAGLKSNRHVFVEKPLCLTRAEMDEIQQAEKASQGSVMVGFNRRFAPATVELKKMLDAAPGPKSMAFHVFPGKLDPESWYANYEESGGRVLGEACHFIDYLCFMTGSEPVSISAQNTWKTEGAIDFPDSVAAQIKFKDGSCGQLIYSAVGDHSYPKEVFTVYGGGLVGKIENFQQLDIHKGRKKTTSKHNTKGHKEEMKAWSNFLNGKDTLPIPFSETLTSMQLTFDLLDAIKGVNKN